MSVLGCLADGIWGCVGNSGELEEPGTEGAEPLGKSEVPGIGGGGRGGPELSIGCGAGGAVLGGSLGIGGAPLGGSTVPGIGGAALGCFVLPGTEGTVVLGRLEELGAGTGGTGGVGSPEVPGTGGAAFGSSGASGTGGGGGGPFAEGNGPEGARARLEFALADELRDGGGRGGPEVLEREDFC